MVQCAGLDTVHRRTGAHAYHPMEHTPGGAEGPLALSPQQCEAWIQSKPKAPDRDSMGIPVHIKVLLNFFQKIAGVQGAAPPVARRSGRNSPCPLPYVRTMAWKPGL